MSDNKITTTTLVIFGVSIVIFLSRLLFLENGYGSDADAWRVANVARYIATTEQYMASRLPGYPLQEIFYSFIWELSRKVKVKREGEGRR